MLTPNEVRKLAKSKFDAKFRFNKEVHDTPMSWSIWKTAFDAGYAACHIHEEELLLLPKE
jgi:hypothetical protein